MAHLAKLFICQVWTACLLSSSSTPLYHWCACSHLFICGAGALIQSLTPAKHGIYSTTELLSRPKSCSFRKVLRLEDVYNCKMQCWDLNLMLSHVLCIFASTTSILIQSFGYVTVPHLSGDCTSFMQNTSNDQKEGRMKRLISNRYSLCHLKRGILRSPLTQAICLLLYKFI